MEQGCESAAGSRRREESEVNSLRECGTAKARIGRENTNSRRYSASFMRSFGEETRSSFRTISSTASSPGYNSLSRSGEIDPSTYSFTTALQALQARSAYNNSWECKSPEGFALNSKWNEAEKYICNPLSGEFPMECLSAKTLSARSYNFPNRITMSAPLIYSSRRRPLNVAQEETRHHFPYQEKRIVEAMSKRDVGTQSTPPPEELSWSSSLSPAASTPSIIERSLNRCGLQPGDSPISSPKLTTSTQDQVKVIETTEESGEEEEEEENVRIRKDQEEKTNDNKKNDKKQMQRRGNGGGCLPWMSKRQRSNNNNNNNNKRRPRKAYLPNLKGC